MRYLRHGVSRWNRGSPARHQVTADGHFELEAAVMAGGHLGYNRVWPKPHQHVVGIVQDHRLLDDEAELRHDRNGGRYRIHVQDLVSIPPFEAVQARVCDITQSKEAQSSV